LKISFHHINRGILVTIVLLNPIAIISRDICKIIGKGYGISAISAAIPVTPLANVLPIPKTLDLKMVGMSSTKPIKHMLKAAETPRLAQRIK
jgi:hypothetical protein